MQSFIKTINTQKPKTLDHIVIRVPNVNWASRGSFIMVQKQDMDNSNYGQENSDKYNKFILKKKTRK